jgi:hypothetical protein
MIDRLGGGGNPAVDDDLVEQDEIPFTDNDIEVTFTDDEPAPLLARKGQNEEDDFFEGDDQDQDELAGASEAVRNRIQRERRLRSEEHARHVQELEHAEQALLQSEIKGARSQRDALKVGIDGLDVRLETAREALIQAKTDGDSGAEIRIDSHIRQLEKLRGEVEGNLSRIPSDQAIEQAFAQHKARVAPQRQAQSGSDGAQPRNQMAERWRDRNAWMDAPGKDVEKAALVRISQQIAAEGIAAESPEHFTELTKRMAKTYPNLGVRDLAGRQVGGAARGQPQNERRSTPPPVGGNRGNVPMSQGLQKSKDGKPLVQLDQSDRRMMRTVGLDPADKKARAYFAKEKLSRLQREQRNGAR